MSQPMEEDAKAYFDNIQETWPLHSFAEGKNQHYRVSSHRSPPNYDLNQDELDWRAVKAMEKEKRDRMVITRANFFYQATSLPFFLTDKLEEAALENRLSFAKPSEPIRFPSELLRPGEFPPSLIANALDDTELQARMNATEAIPLMQKHIEIFSRTALSSQFSKFLQQSLKTLSCKKMVVFGATSMTIGKDSPYEERELDADGNPIPAGASQALLCQHQHIAALHIRKALSEISNEKIPIFLQDPAYSEEDKKVAAAFDMEIVNGEAGHQEGWLELDEDTLVLNFRAEIILCPLAFEITRPAAFFSVRDESRLGAMNPKLMWYTAYSTTIHDRSGTEIKIPGLGIRQYYTALSFSSFLEKEGEKDTKEHADFSEVYRDFYGINLHVRKENSP